MVPRSLGSEKSENYGAVVAVLNPKLRVIRGACNLQWIVREKNRRRDGKASPIASLRKACFCACRRTAAVAIRPPWQSLGPCRIIIRSRVRRLAQGVHSRNNCVDFGVCVDGVNRLVVRPRLIALDRFGPPSNHRLDASKIRDWKELKESLRFFSVSEWYNFVFQHGPLP